MRLIGHWILCSVEQKTLRVRLVWDLGWATASVLRSALSRAQSGVFRSPSFLVVRFEYIPLPTAPRKVPPLIFARTDESRSKRRWDLESWRDPLFGARVRSRLRYGYIEKDLHWDLTYFCSSAPITRVRSTRSPTWSLEILESHQGREKLLPRGVSAGKRRK